jgi:hypothetical protein
MKSSVRVQACHDARTWTFFFLETQTIPDYFGYFVFFGLYIAAPLYTTCYLSMSSTLTLFPHYICHGVVARSWICS